MAPRDPQTEARDLLTEGYLAPLYASILRAALESGDARELEAVLPRMRQRASKAREEADRAEAEEISRRRAAAESLLREHGRAKLEKMLARVEAAQERRYRRWGTLRPDERTARKAYLSNALDAGAREIRAYKDALKLPG